jgi:hypothetical protein
MCSFQYALVMIEDQEIRLRAQGTWHKAQGNQNPQLRENTTSPMVMA